MKTRAAGLLLFFVFAIGCANDPDALHGTSLYVQAFFKGEANDVRTLYFAGQTEAGNDLFPATTRPLEPSPTRLDSPQKVRIFVEDELDQTRVSVSLYAVDKDGGFVQFGSKNATIVKGRQVTVTVDMAGFFQSVDDAGSNEDAGFDAGPGFDAGLPDGGVLQCLCDGGCCAPGQTTCLTPTRFTLDAGPGFPAFNYTLVSCGKPGTFCGGTCDPARSNGCFDGKCTCGTLTCQPGQRCVTLGNGASGCTCDQFSQCQGCCSLGSCMSNQGACGAAGVACTPCTSAVTGSSDAGLSCVKDSVSVPPVAMQGVCSSSSNCALCNGPLQCCSDMRCIGAAWPRCKRSAAANVCASCDLLRSDSCGPLGAGCECGTEGQSCGPQHYCDRSAKPAKCRSIP